MGGDLGSTSTRSKLPQNLQTGFRKLVSARWSTVAVLFLTMVLHLMLGIQARGDNGTIARTREHLQPLEINTLAYWKSLKYPGYS